MLSGNVLFAIRKLTASATLSAGSSRNMSVHRFTAFLSSLFFFIRIKSWVRCLQQNQDFIAILTLHKFPINLPFSSKSAAVRSRNRAPRRAVALFRIRHQPRLHLQDFRSHIDRRIARPQIFRLQKIYHNF